MKGDTSGQGVVPLRTILRNILNLIDSFEARYKEGLDSYDQEFQELKQFSENLKTNQDYLCKEGEKTVNRKKNRYKDILPFDYTRVILGDYGDIPGSDYINANFIKGASGSSAYIACQGPLPHTVNDFWRMVVECEVQVIVMACNEQESGKHKCENYWVEEEGVEREFGQVTVWLKKSRQVCPDFLVRTMKIRYPNSKGVSEERSVCQFHYSAWPDHGVPLKVRPLLDMVRLIRDCQTSETLPVLVHCSAGCGRTGTICAIDYVWGLLRLGKLTSDFSLFNLVRDMRRQRIAMVQTKDQYILVHRAVRELFEEQLKIIDSHPYANVDINGLPLEIRADLEEPVYETVQFATSSAVNVSDEDVVDSRNKPVIIGKPLPPPIPTEQHSSSSVISKPEKDKSLDSFDKSKFSGINQTHLVPVSTIKVTSTNSTPSSSDSQGNSAGTGIANLDIIQQEREIISLPDDSIVSNSKGAGSSKQTSKSSLLRNPSIVKLKAFFERSKDDKEKKTVPTLSRAKSDVSSSSRFYSNFASTFTSRASRRNSPSQNKNSSSSPQSGGGTTSSIEEPRENIKTPVGKVKSKPALLAKPNINVKRSKSLRIIRPSEEPPIPHVQLLSANSINTEIVPDSSKLVRASISSTSSSSSQSHLESCIHPIKVNVKQVDIPKLQKPLNKSMKMESFKGAFPVNNSDKSVKDPQSRLASRKPEIPSKPNLLDNTNNIPLTKGIYGTTRIKIGISDDSVLENSSHSFSKQNGKVKKYGTVNPKILSSAGTLLTRSQSHVWQPSKSQVPVRIFSDENLSQVGVTPSECKSAGDTPNRSPNEQAHGNKVKQSLPLTKLFSSQVKPHSNPVNNNNSTTFSMSNPPPFLKDQPRSLTLTSHSSFLEGRKRVPKTNPYANYTPGSEERQPSYKEKGSNSPLTQFHFGDTVPLLKNGNGNGTIGNSSESSSNPGTPRNSLPGTPTQSIDVLYSPLSLNTNATNYSTSRNHSSRPILKGSLSSTPSESDERLDLNRPLVSASSIQSQVSSNITGPQKISSVRIAVGMRERRNSFRQAVWKEDQAPTATSIPVENDKSENIYITTTSSVPYFVKSSAMPMSNSQNSNSSSLSNSCNVTAKPPLAHTNSGRPHRDYEPIWPDPASSTNSFKIGPTTSTTTVLLNADPHMTVNKSLTNPFLEDGRISSSVSKVQPNSKFEPKVQDRMAEIKVLLEELRSPGKVENAKQRSGYDKDNHNYSQPHHHHLGSNPSQIPLRKQSEKMALSTSQSTQGTTGVVPSTGGNLPQSSSATNLKHHRSLRAPSRPQYEQGFACFTFKKPSSFESITDQLYAEDNLHLARNHGKDQLQGLGKIDDSTPVPPPRSKRMGHLRKEQGNDYANVNVNHNHSQPAVGKYNGGEGWMGNGNSVGVSSYQDESTFSNRQGHIPNGQQQQQRLNDYVSLRTCRSASASRAKTDAKGYQHNGSAAINPSNFKTIRKESSSSSSSDQLDQVGNHRYYGNGHQEFTRLTSTNSIPLSNGNSANVAPSSPKAIIRALGLFQAKAANVRSRFANWTENKERSASKRSNNHGPSNDRGGFEEIHHSTPSAVVSAQAQSTAGPSSTSKRQYL